MPASFWVLLAVGGDQVDEHVVQQLAGHLASRSQDAGQHLRSLLQLGHFGHPVTDTEVTGETGVTESTESTESTDWCSPESGAAG